MSKRKATCNRSVTLGITVGVSGALQVFCGRSPGHAGLHEGSRTGTYGERVVLRWGERDDAPASGGPGEE